MTGCILARCRPVHPSPKLPRAARAASAAVLAALASWTLRDFLPALAWAVVLAIATRRLYGRGRRRRVAGSALPALFTLGVASFAPMAALIPPWRE